MFVPLPFPSVLCHDLAIEFEEPAKNNFCRFKYMQETHTQTMTRKFCVIDQKVHHTNSLTILFAIELFQLLQFNLKFWQFPSYFLLEKWMCCTYFLRKFNWEIWLFSLSAQNFFIFKCLRHINTRKDEWVVLTLNLKLKIVSFWVLLISLFELKAMNKTFPRCFLKFPKTLAPPKFCIFEKFQYFNLFYLIWQN